MGEYEMARDYARENFHYISHVIPDDVWKKIGGQYDAVGNKIKDRKLGKRVMFELQYKRCQVNLDALRKIIKQMPPKGKLYSIAWLWPLYRDLLKREFHLKEVDLTKIDSAPEQDKELIEECLKIVVVMSERVDHGYKNKIFSWIDTYDKFLMEVTMRYEDQLRTRDQG